MEDDCVYCDCCGDCVTCEPYCFCETGGCEFCESPPSQRYLKSQPTAAYSEDDEDGWENYYDDRDDYEGY